MGETAKMTIDEVKAKFGIDPDNTGNRPRGWWIVDKIDEEEEYGNAQIGDLCVKTRDGGSNPISPEAFKVGNCVGSSCDGFDGTYRYYYYRALPASRPAMSEPTSVQKMHISQDSSQNPYGEGR